jgi:hypothetical protein
MEATIKKFTEEQFDKKFKLVKNHIDKNASFDGKMFETYGKEIEYVIKMAKLNRVVTIIECDTEDPEDEDALCMVYASGYHIVNRIGYLILAKPYTGTDFEVKID